MLWLKTNYFFERLKWRCIWSWEGVRDAWVHQHSFRSWVWANLVSAALALYLPLDPAERALILALGVLVLAAEALNTAPLISNPNHCSSPAAWAEMPNMMPNIKVDKK